MPRLPVLQGLPVPWSHHPVQTKSARRKNQLYLLISMTWFLNALRTSVAAAAATLTTFLLSIFARGY